MTVAELLKKAETVEPPARGNYKQLAPVIRKLKERGLTTWAAVSRLISEGAIAEKMRRSAYQSITRAEKRNDK
jgi:hypothetical protein